MRTRVLTPNPLPHLYRGTNGPLFHRSISNSNSTWINIPLGLLVDPIQLALEHKSNTRVSKGARGNIPMQRDQLVAYSGG